MNPSIPSLKRTALGVAAGALLAVLGGAGSAEAATVGWNHPENFNNSDELTFYAGLGVANDLKVEFDDGGSPGYSGDDSITFTDAAESVQVEDYPYGYSPAYTQCVNVSYHRVKCQADDVDTVRAFTFDENDDLDLKEIPLTTYVNVADGNDTVHGGSGFDEVEGGEGTDFAFGNNDADHLYGGPGIDYLYGGAANDELYGGETGADKLEGGPGADHLDGGPGAHDEAIYASRVNPVYVDIGEGSYDDGEAGEHDSVLASTEYVMGGKGPDVLAGDGGPNVLEGREGADWLLGAGGSDVLEGDEGNDILQVSADGSTDLAVCGTDADTVGADAQDDVRPDCEAVFKPQNAVAGGAPGPQGGGAPAQPATPSPKVGFSSSAKVRNGFAKVKLSCPTSAAGSCTGLLGLELASKSVGSSFVAIPSGKTVTANVKLTAAVAKKVAKGPVAVRAIALTQDADSTPVVSKKTITLKR